jgi:hypothetical protein
VSAEVPAAQPRASCVAYVLSIQSVMALSMHACMCHAQASLA